MPANTVNMTAPMDFQTQQQSIERRRKLADALRQDSMTPLQGQFAPGGFYVAPHWTQHAAQLAQALVARKTQDDLDEEERDLVGQQRKFMSDQAEELRYAVTPRPAIEEKNFGPGDARRQFSYMEHTDAHAPDLIRQAEPAYNPTQADQTAAIAKYLNNTGNSAKAAEYVVADAKNQALIRMLKGDTGGATGPSGAGQISSNAPIGGNDGRAPGVGPSPGDGHKQPLNTSAGGSGGAGQASPGGMPPQNAYQLLDPQQRNIVDGYLAAGDHKEAIKYMGDALKPHMSSDGKMFAYRGGKAVVVPGSVEAFGSFKREEKQYDAPVSLSTESGATVQLSPTEWADYQKTNRLPMRFLPENVRDGLQAEADSSGMPGSVNIKTPQGTVGGEITPRIGISQTTAGKQQAEKQGTFFGDTYADLQKKGMGSNDSIAKYQRLSSLLEGVDTGKFTGTTLEIKKAAKAAGIDLGVPDNVGALEAARALTSELALLARNPDSGMGMPGAMSDADRSFLVNMQPGIEQTPEGRRLMIDAAVKMERRKQDIARLAREYKNGQLDNGFFQVVQEYANANPLFPAADTPKPQHSAPPNPASGKVDYKSRYGITTK